MFPGGKIRFMDYRKEQETATVQTRNPYLINYGEYRRRERRETGTEGRLQQITRRKENLQRREYEDEFQGPQVRKNRRDSLQEQRERGNSISRNGVPRTDRY